MQMVNRAELDAELVVAAQAAGVKVECRTPLRQIDAGPELVGLKTDSGVIGTRAVVGADGSASRVGHFVGVKYSQVDLGLEVELEAGKLADQWRGRIHLDWGPIPGSYAWVFPKGDTLTVGVIAAKRYSGETRSYLKDFIHFVGLNELRTLSSSGHLTRCRLADSPLFRGRVLVAGDAAGLVEPWTREGISFALRSGDLAGTTAAEMAKQDGNIEQYGNSYARQIMDTLGREMDAGRQIYKAFSKRPILLHLGMAHTALGWRTFVRLAKGETNFGRVPRHRATEAIVGLLGKG